MDPMTLLEICLDHFVSCHVCGNVVMIELRRLENVLRDLPTNWRVLGLTAYPIDGYSVDVVPEFNPGFGSGVSVAEALASISDWPRDRALWIEVTLTDFPPLLPQS